MVFVFEGKADWETGALQQKQITSSEEMYPFILTFSIHRLLLKHTVNKGTLVFTSS